MISSGVCFGGSGEGSPMVELLGADGGVEIGSFNGMSYGNRYVKLGRYPLGQ